MTRYYMGIDGGGSNLRVVITGESLNTITEAQSPQTANPSSIGRELAAQRLHATIQTALEQAQLTPAEITACGVGIAGASAQHSADWLTATLRALLPSCHLALSSDIEIALVGAHSAPHGILLLAGTGSVALGLNQHTGTRAQVGGWGYLIGDEGGGYWLGREALSLLVNAHDRLVPPSTFTESLLSTLNLHTPRDLIAWLYRNDTPRQREIAGLARVVLDFSRMGDPQADDIVTRGALALAELVSAVRLQVTPPALDLEPLPLAFAGGLLQTPNPLSERVRHLCGLTNFPQAQYSPVIGAALLAKLTA